MIFIGPEIRPQDTRSGLVGAVGGLIDGQARWVRRSVQLGMRGYLVRRPIDHS